MNVIIQIYSAFWIPGMMEWYNATVIPTPEFELTANDFSVVILLWWWVELWPAGDFLPVKSQHEVMMMISTVSFDKYWYKNFIW